MPDLTAFQAFLYHHIPLVKQMQLQLLNCTTNGLTATAPIAPNINDKSTVFGGSSAALMTICGWSLIKYQLEANGLSNDVVIHQANTHWQRAQKDDLIITAQTNNSINWTDFSTQLNQQNRNTSLQLTCQVLNQAKQICSQMDASYVVLKSAN